MSKRMRSAGGVLRGHCRAGVIPSHAVGVKTAMSTDTNTRPRAGISSDGSPPISALVLGWAGVLPFWGLALALATGLDLPVIGDEASALVSYGAIILSFMAGVHWGLAMRAPDAPAGPRATGLLAISVVPAIIAWFATLAPASAAIVILAVFFLVLLPVDLWAIGERLAPTWYRPLRLQLTAAVVTALAVAAISL
jgi:hypothetical protein